MPAGRYHDGGRGAGHYYARATVGTIVVRIRAGVIRVETVTVVVAIMALVVDVTTMVVGLRGAGDGKGRHGCEAHGDLLGVFHWECFWVLNLLLVGFGSAFDAPV
jgi:hypothetical protein